MHAPAAARVGRRVIAAIAVIVVIAGKGATDNSLAEPRTMAAYVPVEVPARGSHPATADVVIVIVADGWITGFAARARD